MTYLHLGSSPLQRDASMPQRCLLAIVIVLLLGCEERWLAGCDERPKESRITRLRRSARAALARPQPPPLEPDGIAPLIAFPPKLSRETLLLCRRLDRDLRYAGEVVHRVGRFLGYANCKTVVPRYRELIDEVTPKLAAHRLSIGKTRAGMGALAAADRPRFWRWLDDLRVWLEDELSSQLGSLQGAAKGFRRRCPKQSKQLAKLSRGIDKIQLRAYVDLHDLFAVEGAPKPDLDAAAVAAPAGTSKALVPIPSGLTAESRRLCQRFSVSLNGGLSLYRVVEGLFRKRPDCAAFERSLTTLDASHRKWREMDRVMVRRYVALLRVRASDLAKVRRWHARLGRRVQRLIRPAVRKLGRHLLGYLRRCPREARRLGAMHRPRLTGGLGVRIERVLAGPRKGWTFDWRWPAI